MSGNISFNQVANSIRVPGSYVEFDNTRALRGLTDWPAKVLIVGQRLTTGTIAQAIPTRVTDANQARTFFGRGSLLANQFDAWFRANPQAEVWGVALDDNAGGTAATGTLTVGGTATAAGVIVLMIDGRRIEVAVTSGQASAAIATAVGAAVNAVPDLVVTAGVAASVVTLTCRHKGEIGNTIPVSHSFYAGEALPTGVTLAVVAMASGALNPVLTTALDAAADTWFTDIVQPFMDTTSLTALELRLRTNSAPPIMRDGVAWLGLSGSHASLITAGNARNNEFLTIIGILGAPQAAYQWAAAMASVAVPALAIDPARPVQTLLLPGSIPPQRASRFTYTERDLLLRNGISTVTTNDAGQVFIERAITTYQTAPSGVADISFLDVETIKTLAYLRYDLRALIALRFPRHKLADDGTNFARGQAVVTPGTIRAEIIARFKQWESSGLVEGVDQFKADIIVRRNASDPNRVDALLPPDLVNQFRVFAAQIEFLL